MAACDGGPPDAVDPLEQAAATMADSASTLSAAALNLAAERRTAATGNAVAAVRTDADNACRATCYRCVAPVTMLICEVSVTSFTPTPGSIAETSMPSPT